MDFHIDLANILDNMINLETSTTLLTRLIDITRKANTIANEPFKNGKYSRQPTTSKIPLDTKSHT